MRETVWRWRELSVFLLLSSSPSADSPSLSSYFPLTGGPGLEKVTEVWSTWRFEYTEAETDKMVALAKGKSHRSVLGSTQAPF